jgi:ABC-type transport system involved in multi-copper enzyme maturation permease subunit
MGEPRHNGVTASLRRVRLIAGHTLGEALRMRLAILLALTGVALVLAALWLREFNFGAAELKFVGDFGLGAIGFLGTLLASLASAQLFFSDLTSGEVGCALTRPVRRWEYVWGKLAGVSALLALFTAALALVLGAVITIREAQLGASLVPLPVFLQACAMVWLKITLVAAMTLLVCSYAGTALFATCAGLLLAMVAHLRPFASAGGALAVLRIWPNLALFDAESLLATGHSPAGPWLLGLAGYWAAYVLLFGGLASHVFKRREF